MEDAPLLSIGALSRATGVPVETLRTWERRYGFPVPERLPSGHRRYPFETVDRLRRVRRAINRGHRASEVVPASETTLRAYLGDAHDGQALEEDPILAADLEEALRAIAQMETAQFERVLWRAWSRLGALRFAREFASLLVVEIGERWRRLEVRVGEEHVASEALRDFLAKQWRELQPDRPSAAFLATLPGETHVLGLHLAAVVTALHRTRVEFFGPDTPLEELVVGARQRECEAIVISVSSASNVSRAQVQLRELREAVPDSIPIVVGGAAAPTGVQGVETIIDLAEYAEWLISRAG